MPAALIAWLNKTFKFLSMLITGHYPAGFLILVYLPEIDSPLVALTLVTLLLKKLYCQPLLFCTRCHNHGTTAETYAELTSSMSIRGSYTSLVKYWKDTQPGHQFEASRKQHEVLCERLKAKKVILHTILLGVGGSIYTSHTLNHLRELGLDTQKAHKTALKLHAHSVLYAN